MIVFDRLTEKIEGKCVLAIGVFDGVHKGHMNLIKNAKKKAELLDCKLVVMTFSNLPRNIFSDNKSHYILSNQIKRHILSDMGVDILYSVKFDENFSKIEPENFIAILFNAMDIKEIFIGFNFRFGYKNRGGLYLLKYLEKKYKYKLNVLKPVKINNETVSSSFIREKIRNGDVAEVQDFLGRPFFLSGTVIKGKKIGRELGFPTANIMLDSESMVKPSNGVYIFKAILKDKTILNGAGNIGFVPSFSTDERLIKYEIHFFDFKGDLYGEHIIFSPLKFIRPELKLSRDELIIQIDRDIETAKKFFKRFDNQINKQLQDISKVL